jgi:hypothetical protein
MSIEPNYIVGAIAIGIGATLLMDLWNLFLKLTFNVPSLNYCLLGRWLRHMPEGTFGLLFVVLVSGAWLARPTLLIALLYGVGTVVFPFFIMQPSLGLGIAASKTPNPMQARLKSIVTHTVFGVGLYLSALGVSKIAG